MSQDRLVLGPLLRHVDQTSAAIWVQTDAAATVSVRLDGDERTWSAPTFGVHGQHYALIEVTGLQPGLQVDYSVLVDGEKAWPRRDQYPRSGLRTLPADREPRLAFGSCRTSVPHDTVHHATHGVDALRAFGIAVAQGRGTVPEWPDTLMLLGDQVYADELSDEMKRFIEQRRSLAEPPGAELKDYEEYAHLYTVAWGEPWMRWLLSNLSTLMIFDDHDVRDDWNTSVRWREQMARTSWWHGRIVAALASYWVYQHLGNLSVAQRAEDEIWARWNRLRDGRDGEVDLTDILDAFAARVDANPDSYRWSYARRFGSSRLAVVDSRAARVLQEGRRSMLDPSELRWLDEQLSGDCDHVLVATSLPFLLPTGLHHVESWDEALADGVWGRRAARLGERLRQALDLEHWAAYQDSFRAVAQMVLEVADGRRGVPPKTVTFLSGDVHNSYIAEVDRKRGTRILQFVCSPIRNPLPRAVRAVNVVMSHRIADWIGQPLARRAKVPEAPFTWRTIAGPWYHNNFAVLQMTGARMRVTWWAGANAPQMHLQKVAQVDIELDGSLPARAAIRPRWAAK